MQSSYWHEVWVILGVVAVSLLLGYIFDHVGLFLLIGLGLYLSMTMHHLRRLHQWLLNKKRGQPPEAGGLWGEVFNEIFRLEKQASKYQELLRTTAQRFQEAALALPDAIVVLSQSGTIEWANPAAQRMLGIHYPPDAGQRIHNLLRAPAFVDYLEQENFSQALTFAAPGNPGITLVLQVIPYGSKQRLILCRDVTHVVQLEHMRQTFVANASHELRSPITVLSGYLETLRQMDVAQEPIMVVALENMYQQAQRMERLVADLLTLTRLETTAADTSESVDVGAMLLSLKESAQLMSKDKAHQVNLELASDDKLLGNKEQLRSVFTNLIDNAVRYTQPGGKIDISWRRQGDSLIFSVRDNGEGIAPRHIPRLTERFYRVDADRSRESGGTGLGLAIVKHILTHHEARLEVDSRIGQGSQFSCRFPAARGIARQTESRLAESK